MRFIITDKVYGPRFPRGFKFRLELEKVRREKEKGENLSEYNFGDHETYSV